MRYLFFDIECANCFNNKAKICEFGYVITDENFNLIEQECIFINPEAKFDRRVLKEIVNFPEKKYIQSPVYPEVYEQIKKIITYPEQMIFGCAMDQDTKFLNESSIRYNLPSIDYAYVDLQQVYIAYKKADKKMGLSALSEEIGSERKGKNHKGDDDAHLTMSTFKKLCDIMNVQITDLRGLFNTCGGKNSNYTLTTDFAEYTKQQILDELSNSTCVINPMRGRRRQNLFVALLHDILITDDCQTNELKGKLVAISLEYEKNHFRQILNLITMLAAKGCMYTTKSSEADYYIEYDEMQEQNCNRKAVFLERIDKGEKIKIIPFLQILDFLSTTEDGLNKMSFPKITEYLYALDYSSTNLKKKYDSSAI